MIKELEYHCKAPANFDRKLLDALQVLGDALYQQCIAPMEEKESDDSDAKGSELLAEQLRILAPALSAGALETVTKKLYG